MQGSNFAVQGNAVRSRRACHRRAVDMLRAWLGGEPTGERYFTRSGVDGSA